MVIIGRNKRYKRYKIQKINFFFHHPRNCCFCFTNCLNIPERQAVAIHTSSVVYLFEQTNHRITLCVRTLDQHISFINDMEGDLVVWDDTPINSIQVTLNATKLPINKFEQEETTVKWENL